MANDYQILDTIGDVVCIAKKSTLIKLKEDGYYSLWDQLNPAKYDPIYENEYLYELIQKLKFFILNNWVQNDS